MASSTSARLEPRAVCARCRRPESVCYCRHLTSLETKTRVLLLQHPRERDVAIGTARMASLCLPNAELHVGVHFRGSAALSRALSDPARPAVLLYPGAGAIDVAVHPPAGPVTLVVVDGTWWQAKKLVRENPEIAALPRYSFTPPNPSEYRIRKEPDAAYVSTIEALVHVLGALEGDPERFRALLLPFRAMIDAQIACQAQLRGSGGRHAAYKAARKPRRPHIHPIIGEREDDLVCIVGEANAWPYRCVERAPDCGPRPGGAGGVPSAYPDELVHWVARRMKTGETFEVVVAPKHPLAPRTTSYIELSEGALAAGVTTAEMLERWRAFVRDTDVVCSWGRYGTALFASQGGYLPPSRLDLRQVARVYSKGKVGMLEEFAASMPAPSPSENVSKLTIDPAAAPAPRGRAGLRLKQVASIAAFFVAAAREQR